MCYIHRDVDCEHLQDDPGIENWKNISFDVINTSYHMHTNRILMVLKCDLCEIRRNDTIDEWDYFFPYCNKAYNLLFD